MLGFFGTAVALAGLAGGAFQSIAPITPEMAVAAASKCGLGPVVIRYDAILQSDTLSLPEAVSATESQLVCVDNVTEFGILVELPGDLQPRFDSIRERRASAVMKAEARAWLSKHGLLERVPEYVSGKTDDAAFTRAVEQLCGPRATGAFQSRYGSHVLNPEWVAKLATPPDAEDMDAMACPLNVTTLVGFGVGLVGNETDPSGQ
ncbi:MAG: hypothetical protein EOP58_01940 [Sphingomonadales bacterium]|nr:MAG: hypothetical protein EOP58_01940 [Sphingomonadales bacterium]